MAATITAIGTATGSTIATVAITVPAGGVPLGALIVVCVADSSVSALGGSVGDTGGNTYTRITGADNNNLTTNGFGAIFSAPVTTALVQNNTITYTLALTANAASTAFYVQTMQASPIDALVTNVTTGSSTAPSVAGLGAPAGSGEFWVGAVSNTGPGTETFTQDSSNAAWLDTPPTRVGIAVTGPTIAGGAITSGLTTALTYAPTLGTSHPWAAMIVAFKVQQPAFNLPQQLGPTLAQ